MQNAYMRKDSAITVRLPVAVKRRLESRARAQHRSLSAQVVAELEDSSRVEPAARAEGGRFLGRFRGARVATDGDIAEVRGRLWGRLSRAERRG